MCVMHPNFLIKQAKTVLIIVMTIAIIYNVKSSSAVHRNEQQDAIVKARSEPADGVKHKQFDLSVIITSRDDDYGGNSTERLARAMQQLVHFPWDIQVELIIVDWNVSPVHGKHLYQNKLVKLVQSSQQKSKNVLVKFITVPEEVALRPNKPGRACRFFEYYAKNVALRRSSGAWKLATNQDDLFSDTLLSFINANIQDGSLDPDVLYQKDRGERDSVPVEYDFNQMIPMNDDCLFAPHDNGTDGTCYLEKMKSEVGNCGDFQMFHKSILKDSDPTSGYLEVPGNWFVDSEFILRHIHLHQKPSFVIKGCSMCHQPHERRIGADMTWGGPGTECDQSLNELEYYRKFLTKRKKNLRITKVMNAVLKASNKLEMPVQEPIQFYPLPDADHKAAWGMPSDVFDVNTWK